MWLSGFSPDATRALEQELAPLGLRVLAGPGSSRPAEVAPVFAPGAPLGVQLIGGDMSATAIGTITHIEGDKVIGFGHPMFWSGPVDMPMTAAYIYGVVPNQVSSFKLGAATQAVGAVRQDRAAGIAGVLGPPPAMLPMEVVVGNDSFRFELLRHRQFTAGLALSALLGAVNTAVKARGSVTLEVQSQILMAGGQRLEHTQVYSGDDLLFSAARQAVLPLAALGQSSFSAVDIDTLRFVVEVSDGLEQATISHLQLETGQPLIGQNLALNITLKPYRRPPENRAVEVLLPADMPPGPFTLRVGSGQAGQNWEIRRRPDTFRPRNAEQLLEVLGYQERNDELIIEVYQSEESLTVDGRELPGLPPSVRSILRQTPASGRVGPVLGRVVHRQRLRTPYVLSGEQTLELNAKRP